MPVIPTEIIDRYIDLLEPHVSFCEPDPGTSTFHLRWMLDQLHYMKDMDKANRWLGFIQGVLVMRGYTTVREERDFTRPFFKNEG